MQPLNIRESLRNDHFQPFELGWRAGLRKAREQANPYQGGSLEGEEWERWRKRAEQYRQALKS